MNWQDILAYSILFIAYVGLAVPFVGAQLTQNHGSLYREDWLVGATIHGVLIVFVLVLGAVLWAVFKVL